MGRKEADDKSWKERLLEREERMNMEGSGGDGYGKTEKTEGG